MDPKNPGPRAISRMAALLLTQFAANPPPWAGEFQTWARQTFGPRPSQVRRRAAQDHDVATVGALMAWNYLAEAIEEVEETNPEHPDGPVPPPSPSRIEPPLPEEPTPNMVEVPRRPFAVLGADGEPMIEGLTDWEAK